MADLPGRPALEPEDREGGADDNAWGSPLPAEYGSLQSVRQGDPRSGLSPSAGRARVGRDRDHRSEGSNLSDLRRRVQGFDAVPAIAEEPAAPQPTRKELGAARRAARVRSKATIRHLDVLSVAKVSLIFYLIVLLVFVIASVLMWYAADAFGTLSSFEKSIRNLFSLKSFTVRPGTVALYTAAVGGVIAVAGTLANVLLAFIFNLISDVVSGIKVEIDSYPTD